MGLKVGDYVSIIGTCRYGRIIRIVNTTSVAEPRPFKFPKTVIKYTFAVVEYDSSTGKPLDCRYCENSRKTCPICTYTRKEDDLSLLSDRDIEEFRNSGLITD